MTSTLIRHASWLYTCDRHDRAYSDAFVLVEDGRITQVGREPWTGPEADDTHDLSGCIVVPGFVCLHHHFFQSLFRAVPSGVRATALQWLHAMYPVWAQLDPEVMYWASKVAAAELVLTGATCGADHSYLLPGAGSDVVDEQVRAAGEIGLRLHLVRGCMPTMEGDLEERLRPVLGKRLDAMIDRENELFPRMERDLERYHDLSDGAMTRVALGPTGVTYGMPDLMKRIADFAADNGCGLHTHYLPRPIEREMSERLTGRSSVKFLDESGWLRPGTWFAHCPTLNDEEIAAFADTGCAVAHCPRTVVRLGYKVTRISDMRRRGLRIGIGVDGASSNDDGSMLGDLRLALLLHRAGSDDTADPLTDWLTPYDALLMATREGAAALGRSDIGAIAPGMAADIAAFDLRRVGYAGAVADPLGALLLCGTDAHAAMTMVNGRTVVKQGKLVGTDEDDLVARANTVALGALERAGKETGIDFLSYPGLPRQPPRPGTVSF